MPGPLLTCSGCTNFEMGILADVSPEALQWLGRICALYGAVGKYAWAFGAV